jgi:Putative beta-barrel porin 2
VLASARCHCLIGSGLGLAGRILLCVMVMLAVTTTSSRAQFSAQPVGVQIFYTPPQPLAAELDQMKSGSDPRPTTTAGKFQFYDWLLSANAGFGSRYDTNVNSTVVNPQAVWGANFQPTLLAEYNTGIQRTDLYLNGDVVYYPSIGRTTLDGTRGGVIHVWEIQRDLIFRIQGQAAEVQSGSSFNNFLTTGIYATNPVNYTQFFGSSSIQKEFGMFFTAIGGSVTETKYQNTTDNLGNVIDEQFQNGAVYTANYRLGYHITPLVYTYVEPSYNWTRYEASNLDSDGYRVVAGIGSGLISLFSGEIYGGYLEQRFDDPTIGKSTSPVFGGKFSWFPTPFLTLVLTGDETFGTTDANALAFTPGSPTKLTTVKLTGNWDFTTWYAFTAGVSNQQINYLNSPRNDNFLSYNAGIIWKIRPGFGLQFGYAHQHLSSNVPGNEYSRDLFTVSGNTRF